MNTESHIATLRTLFEDDPPEPQEMVSDLTSFRIAIAPGEDPLPAACGSNELMEIEKRCGAISGVVRRFANVEAGFTECGHLLEILLTAGSPDAYPSRAEIDRWILERGLGDTILCLLPFLDRTMGGAAVAAALE